MSEKTHLTRIVAPTLNDASITKSLSDAIDVINENFRKLASTPFLQGVKGDAYHTTVRHIFEDGKITNDGALLLNCIFETNISGGTTINDICEAITAVAGNSVPGSPLDSLISYVDSKPVFTNNDLYFYTLVDDAGDEYGEQLGQYYYFVDGRIKNLSDAYNSDSKTGLNKFVDYSGFYRYIPATDENNAKYERVEFLPTLYYDTENNDICWKYYNTKTGLSAIGPKGANGVSSIIKVVRVKNLQDDGYGVIDAVASNKDLAYPDIALWDEKEIDIDENTPLVICFKQNDIWNFAIGVAKHITINNKVELCGVFDSDSVINVLMDRSKITDYLLSINNTQNTDDPKALPIPYGSKTKDTKTHMLSGDMNGGLVLRKNFAGAGKFILDKYSIVVTDYDDNEIDTTACTDVSASGITLEKNECTTKITGQGLDTGNAKIGRFRSGWCAEFSNNIITNAGKSTYLNNESKEETNYVGMPIGSIIMYMGYISKDDILSKNKIKIGNCWLLCNGADLGKEGNRNPYTPLIQKIGNTLPDFRGYFPIGAGKINNESEIYSGGEHGGRNCVYLNINTGNDYAANLKYAGMWLGDANQLRRENDPSGGIGIGKYDAFDASANIGNIVQNSRMTNYKNTIESNDYGSAGIGILKTARTLIPTVPMFTTVHFLIKYR